MFQNLTVGLQFRGKTPNEIQKSNFFTWFSGCYIFYQKNESSTSKKSNSVTMAN